jgi:hypothetical protein
MQLESMETMILDAQKDITVYSKNTIGVKADGALTINSGSASWGAGSTLVVTAAQIDFNGPAAGSVTSPALVTKTLFDEVKFNTSVGWETKTNELTSICSRITTHEPYPYHNKGVDIPVAFESGYAVPPGSSTIPAAVNITKD